MENLKIQDKKLWKILKSKINSVSQISLKDRENISLDEKPVFPPNKFMQI